MAFSRRSLFYFLVSGLFVALCLGVFLFFRGSEQRLPFSVWSGQSSSPSSPYALYIGAQRYVLEIADTKFEQERGLGGRESLCESCGMLFLFETSGQHAFWMKDMHFPLDIVWLSGETVVFIARDIQSDFPGIIDPAVSADRVLEVNASMAQTVNIGDSLRFVQE